MSDATTARLRDYLAKVLPGGGLEELADTGAAAESMLEAAWIDATAPAAAPPARPEAIRSAAEKLAQGAELDREEQFVTEAIIIPDKRPAVLVQDGDYRVAHALWTHYDQDPGIRQRLRTAIASIGRVELPDHPSLPYGGTGFVVGPDLLMTNRHVAEIFASGLGLRDLRFRPGLSAGVDFLREHERDGSIGVKVREVAMIHPHWDMALLRVEGLGNGQPPLELALEEPEALEGEEIAVIGYPAFDPRNDAGVQGMVFGGIYNVKRLQPGVVGPRRRTASFGRSVDAATHDSSTLGGNSGSAVISARTGRVVALHFGGRYLDANFGVPTGELALDARVVDAGVRFAGKPAPRPDAFADAWRDVSGQEAAVAIRPEARDGSVTVTVPVTITLSLGGPVQGA
ncbi:serine protease [Paracoccus sp. S-4012]|uniref:trypsin-like serine peptidase n=1 Tax=Paracoccus sp. S-4012 TaxID=2665648 RepID=UPI0012B00906|nr:serine protease [Paracoccus sp. S-4012]MRX51188.1 serine protease [Paracoccus sp. S-4012]